jgi:hypothetical protein
VSPVISALMRSLLCWCPTEIVEWVRGVDFYFYFGIGVIGQESAASLAALLMGVDCDLVLQCLVGGMAMEEMPREVVEKLPERFPKL